jgi:hypothetical protein
MRIILDERSFWQRDDMWKVVLAQTTAPSKRHVFVPSALYTQNTLEYNDILQYQGGEAGEKRLFDIWK